MKKIVHFCLYILTTLATTSLLAATTLEKGKIAAPTSKISCKTVRKMTFCNDIKPEDLGYRYWGIHYPCAFNICVNDIQLPMGKTCTLAVPDDTVHITYQYSFAKGLYKGTNQTTFKLKPKATQSSIMFDWKNRIILDGGTPISFKKLKS